MADPKIKVEIGAVADGLIKNVDGSIRSLEQLQRELDDLDKKLRTAADPTEIVQLNQQIGALKVGMQSLRTAGIDPLTRAQSNYNSVGVDFARIIQDAPFGIIGVSNNITQLASSFQAARASGQSFKSILGSVFSAGNAVTLGISAITTALVLYEQGLFGAKEGLDDLKQAQDDYNDSLKETDRILGREVLAQFLKDVGLSETQNLGGRLIDVPTFKTAEEVITRLDGKIKTLRKGELDLLAKFLKTEISEALRDVANAENELGKELAQDDLKLYRGILNQVNTELSFYKDSTESAKESSKKLKFEVDELKRSFEDLSNLPTLGLPGQNLEDLARRLRARREELQTGGLVDPNSLQNAIANAPGISTTLPITGIATQFQTEADKIKLTVEDLSQAFTGLGSLIGKAFENPQLGTFLGQFATFAAKLIATNFKIAGSNAVAGATSAAAATGPAAPFTLAGFIAASLGLVASAFSAFGGGRGSAGSFSGASGVSAGTSFAGAGQGLQFDRSLNLVGEFRVKGQDLVYVLNEANSRNQRG
jgi:hypothetical protein